MKQLIIDRNIDINQKSKFHTVPCSLSYDCDKVSDVQVSNYFEQTFNTVNNMQTKEGQLTATIQGHKLVGTEYNNLKDLYSCFCYRKPQTQNIELIAVQKIQTIIDWRKDIKWKKNQGPIGNTILYSNLLQILHSDIQNVQNINEQVDKMQLERIKN